MSSQKQSEPIKRDNQTPFQKFVDSKPLDYFILSVIIINCGFMAGADPKVDTEPPYAYYGTWIINIIFILECFSRILAYGFVTYIMDPWRVLDFIVVLVSLIEVIIPLIDAVSQLFNGPPLVTADGSILRVLRIMRTLRVLRPLKAISFIPSLQVYIDAVFMCFRSAMMQTLVLAVVFVSLSFFSHAVIGDKLMYRCVPTDFTDSLVTSNLYYQEYGIDYFYSRYNYEFCGNSHKCSSGFSCISIDLPFEGSTADYSTPFRAFISNFAFTTLRGWPIIFCAIADVKSRLFAWFILVVLSSATGCLCVNMYPAIFLSSLKQKEDVIRKVKLIEHYPGDALATPELELLVWASRNEDFIKRRNHHVENQSGSLLLQLFNLLPCCSKTFFHQRDLDKKGKPHYPDSTNPNKYSCVPSSQFFINLRRATIVDGSAFSKFIAGVVFLNIGILALDSSNPSDIIALIIKLVNIVCSTIFFAEIVIKFTVSGPVLYFADGWNILDLFLSLMSIPFFINDSSSFSQNFRAARLLRLARLSRLTQVYKVVRSVDVEASMLSRNPSMTIARFVGMLLDISLPITNVFMLTMIFFFIFSILGMQFFAIPRGPDYDINIDATYDNYLIAPLIDLKTKFAGGKYLDRMNFNCFGNAFVTIQNIASYNGWYVFMVEIKRRIGGYAVVYFIMIIIIVDYFIFATLTASLIGLMEMNADSLLATISEDNKKFLSRISEIRQKCVARHYFNVFKQKTIESEEAQAAVATDAAPKMKREEIDDAYEAPVDTNFVEAFYESTAHSSFYMFSASNPVRVFSRLLLDNSIFQGGVLFAIFVAATSIITNRSEALFSASFWNFLDIILLIIFLVEMFMIMIRDTVWDTRGFIYSIQNVADLVVNIFMVLDFFLSSGFFDRFRIIRLVKMAGVIKFFLRNKTLDALLKALEGSVSSTMAIMAVVLIIIFYTSVIGLQSYSGSFSRCSYDGYPGGRARTEVDTTYPNGCNGYANINWNNQGNYEWINIYWYQTIDNFDDIFKSCRVVVRVFFNFEWQAALYGALDSVGTDLQPENNSSREAYIYFIIMYIFGFALCSMPVAVIYYHHYLIIKSSGKKASFGGNASMWIIYEGKLLQVKPVVTGTSVGKSEWRVKLLEFVKNNKVYNTMIVAIMSIPIFWIFVSYDDTYSKDNFVTADLAFSLFFVFDYILRFIAFGPTVLTTTMGQQDAVAVCGVVIAAFFSQILKTSNPDLAKNLVLIQIIIRLNRLTFVFPELAELLDIQMQALIGYVPLALYLCVTVLVFGVFLVILCGKNRPDFGVSYLNDRLNFDNYNNAWVLLLAMGSGNVYSEVFAAYRDNMPLWEQAVFEAVACLYSFIFYVLFRCFCVLMVNKYLDYYGDKLGVAGQQIRHFQLAWELLGNPSTICYEDLYRLIRMLPPPLGLGSAIIPYLDQSRFVKKIIACTPMNVKDFNDYDPKKRRQIFLDDEIPDDIRDWDESVTSTLRFTFTQVILAFHKNFILSKKLIDELDSVVNRKEAKERVQKITVRIARVITSRNFNGNVDIVTKASRNLLLLQRLDLEAYKILIVDIVAKMLFSIELQTAAFGFKGFDIFVLSNLTKIINDVFHSFSLQAKVKKGLCKDGVDDLKILQAAESMQHHFLQAKRYHSAVNALYDSKIEKLWEVEGLEEITSMRERKGVTAICTDGGATIFCAINPGKIKVFTNTGSSHEITKKTAFRMTQMIKLGGAIRSLCSSNDSKKVIAGCENELVLIVLVPKRGRKPQYVITQRYNYHSDPINKVMFWESYMLSFGNDGYICLWSQRESEPVNVISAGASVFCATVISTVDSNTAIDEVTMTEALVCGLNNGNLQLVPLPLINGPPGSEKMPLVPKVITAGTAAVSCICFAWGFVYTGFTDGTLKTWAIILNKDTQSGGPINQVNLELVQNITVHAAPICSLLYSGNFLFTVSHDFSMIPFKPPEKVSAKSAAQFFQDHMAAYIIHNSPIICATSNKYGLISCDDEGFVKISAPQKATDLNKTDADSMSGSRYKLSFLQYSFEEVFISHQGLKSEEEAILEITNTSFESITVRCLLSKNNNFSVDFYELHNQSIGIKSKYVKTSGVKQNKKTAIEIGPQQTAKMKIIFAPTETIMYRCEVQFLINERELVKVVVKGHGVKSKVVAANNQKVFDFEVVDVGKTKVEIVTLVNTSPRDVILTFFDRPIEDKLTGETISFASKDMTIMPRCLKLGPKETSKLIVQYSPTVPHTTFTIPLKAAIHGAEYTIGKVIARSQVNRDGPPDTDLATHSTEKREAVKFMTRGLRPLLPTENICPSDLSDVFLDKCGWKINYNDDLILFYHLRTGQFLEIPRAAPGIFRPEITDIQIDFICHQKVIYELWLGNRMVTTGKADENEVGVVDISVDDIYMESSNDTLSLGLHIFELLIFTPGQKKREGVGKITVPDPESDQFGRLQTITHIKVLKGFRISKFESDGIVELSKRVAVLGIERVVTFLDDDAGSIYEIYGEQNDLDKGTRTFSPLIMSVGSKLSPTHYQVTDTAAVVEKETNKIKEHITNFSDLFHSSTSNEVIVMPRPVMPLLKGDDHVSRKIEVVLQRQHFTEDKEVITLKDLQTLSHECHTTKHVHHRALKNEVSEDLLLPHQIQSYSFSVSVRVIAPEDEPKKLIETFDNLLDSLVGGKFKKPDQSVLHGQWHFVLDLDNLKLVYSEVITLEDPEEEMESKYESTEIRFTTSGFVAKLCDDTAFKSDNGFVMYADNLETLNTGQNNTVTLFNTGKAFVPEPYNLFLGKAWDIIVKDEMVKALKTSLKKMAEKRLDILTRSADEKIQIKLQEFKEMESKMGKKVNMEQQKKEMYAACDAIRKTVPEKITPAFIFEVIAKDSNEYYSSNYAKTTPQVNDTKTTHVPKLNIFKFRYYLERVPIFGATEPMSKARSEIVLRELNRDDSDIVSPDAFKFWFNTDNSKKVIEGLTGKTLLALVTNDVIGDGDTQALHSKDEEVEADAEHIKQLHLDVDWDGTSHEAVHVTDVLKMEWHDEEETEVISQKRSWKSFMFSDSKSKANESAHGDSVSANGDSINEKPKRKWFSFLRKKEKAPDNENDEGVEIKSINKTDYSALDSESKLESDNEESGADENGGDDDSDDDLGILEDSDEESGGEEEEESEEEEEEEEEESDEEEEEE